MFSQLPFDLSTDFDPETLQAHPKHPLQVRSALLYLKARLKHTALPLLARVECQNQYALLLRLAQRYDEAIPLFEKLIQEWQTPPLSQLPQHLARGIALRIRLAHTHQFQKNFAVSDALFETLLQDSEQWDAPLKAHYQHFLWQHLGKNHFDQQQYDKAQLYFEKALAERQQQGLSQELVDSSTLALSVTQQRRLAQI